MTQNPQKEIQEASLIGRILSVEAFLLLMGVVSLIYGIVNDMGMNIFWAVVIIPGVFILHKVRKKDWTKHWQDMEAEESLLETRRKAREKAEAEKN